MTYEDWFDYFEPIKNEIDPNASMDGYAFETFGAEKDFVKDQPEDIVWTIVESDGVEELAQGFHHINRMGYMVVSVPYNEAMPDAVLLDDAEVEELEDLLS